MQNREGKKARKNSCENVISKRKKAKILIKTHKYKLKVKRRLCRNMGREIKNYKKLMLLSIKTFIFVLILCQTALKIWGDS